MGGGKGETKKMPIQKSALYAICMDAYATNKNVRFVQTKAANQSANFFAKSSSEIKQISSLPQA